MWRNMLLTALAGLASPLASLSPHAPAHSPSPNPAPASAAATRPVMNDDSRKRSQRSLEIFIKVTCRLAVRTGLNKHSQNQALRAARVLLLVGGSVTGASLLPSMAVPESRVAAAASGTVPGAAVS